MACVYALSSSLDPSAVRYIGRSNGDDGKARLKKHLEEARHGTGGHKNNWVRSAISAGGEITSTVLESELSWDESAVREIFFIAHYRGEGVALTNGTDGGDGLLGFAHSDESRAKMSVARRRRPGKPHTVETKTRMSVAQKGRPGKPHTAESRARISAAQMGHPVSIEARAKISAAASKAREATQKTIEGVQ